MRSLLFLVVLALCAGCASIQMTDYVQSKYPYARTYKSDLARTIEAVKKVLAQNGYPMASSQSPSVYERGDFPEGAVVLMTQIRTAPRILWSRYSHLNVYILPVSDRLQVEMRYESALSVLGLTFRSARQDALVKKLFRSLERELDVTPLKVTP